jgi:hypothetical protein
MPPAPRQPSSVDAAVLLIIARWIAGLGYGTMLLLSLVVALTSLRVMIAPSNAPLRALRRKEMAQGASAAEGLREARLLRGRDRRREGRGQP